MPAGLSESQARFYGEQGYVAPIPVFGETETRDLRGRFEALLAREGGTLSRSTNTRSHRCPG